jgi:hypothetical protein
MRSASCGVGVSACCVAQVLPRTERWLRDHFAAWSGGRISRNSFLLKGLFNLGMDGVLAKYRYLA